MIGNCYTCSERNSVPPNVKTSESHEWTRNRTADCRNRRIADLRPGGLFHHPRPSGCASQPGDLVRAHRRLVTGLDGYLAGLKGAEPAHQSLFLGTSIPPATGSSPRLRIRSPRRRAASSRRS